jgi:hypothetical protein
MTAIPQRIQLRRVKGFNLQAESRKLNGLEAVNCSRPGSWANRFKVGETYFDGAAHIKILSNEHAVKLFNDGVRKNTVYRALARESLRGKNLACWCKTSEPCHCDFLLRIANEDRGEEIK